MSTHKDVQRVLKKYSTPAKAKANVWFFKTEKGEYGHGDKFIGVTVPKQRAVAKKFRDLPLHEVLKLLKSPMHEHRLIALFLLVQQYNKGDSSTRQKIVNAYLVNRKFVNNWDLVDSSASYILGDWLLTRPRSILYKLARSTTLWDRRIAMISTGAFIRAGEYDDTLKIAGLLLYDAHDLIHKATGWMLREVGNKDKTVLVRFLNKHAHHMPRTMLRYAIEKFPHSERKRYMAM